MVESRLTRILLRSGALLTLAFIYLPLFVIALYAFNKNITQAWPIEKYSTRWFSVAVNDPVICNGFDGTVVTVHVGTLAGMVDVRLDRGVAPDARLRQTRRGPPARRRPADLSDQ